MAHKRSVMMKISDSEWSQLEIRLIVFCWSTILQKLFITIIMTMVRILHMGKFYFWMVSKKLSKFWNFLCLLWKYNESNFYPFFQVSQSKKGYIITKGELCEILAFLENSSLSRIWFYFKIIFFQSHFSSYLRTISRVLQVLWNFFRKIVYPNIRYIYCCCLVHTFLKVYIFSKCHRLNKKLRWTKKCVSLINILIKTDTLLGLESKVVNTK